MLIGMYWGLTQKRICAYRWMKRGGFFNRLQEVGSATTGFWQRGL